MKLWEVESGRCIRTFEGHTGWVSSVCLSFDSRWALSGSGDETLMLWKLDWELESVEPPDRDEGARPYLETFLTLHTPYGGKLPEDRKPAEEEIRLALTRKGKPSWREEDFQKLLQTLSYAGYGWINPDGIRREMEKITREKEEREKVEREKEEREKLEMEKEERRKKSLWGKITGFFKKV